MRVIRPRFVYRTGHVTIGGSICTEMLTSAGWSPTMTMESVRHLRAIRRPPRALSTPPHAPSQVLLAIRANMLDGGARIDTRQKHDYTEIEARAAYERMVREHGWY